MGWTVEILNTSVAAEIDGWPLPVRASLLKIVERIEAVGLQSLREPHVKHLRGKIWEMRPSAGGNDGRALYVTATGAHVVIVVAFLKKGQMTPQHWLELAEARAKDIK